MAAAGLPDNHFINSAAPTQQTQPAPLVYVFPAHNSNPQRALTPTMAIQYYPAHPTTITMNISMLHPVAYLPPSGVYLNASHPAIELGGDKYCRTCLEPLALHDPSIQEKGIVFPCPHKCGLEAMLLASGCSHSDHTGHPCPQLYIGMRLAKRSLNIHSIWQRRRGRKSILH